MHRVFKAFVWILPVATLLYLLFMNTLPYGMALEYKNGDLKNLTKLGPSTRATTNEAGEYKLTDNPVYFSSNMPFLFEHAKTRVVFKNPSPEQPIAIGYKDQQEWHYNTKVISAPFLDQLNWPKVGDGPYLYQKVPTYTSAQQFINDPPKDKLIGVYDYDAAGLQQASIKIDGYAPAKQDTVIDVPLRGKTTMYLYLKGEPFRLKLAKRDLNWYADPDVMKVTVYKQKDIVYTATLDDDGNTTDNHKLGGIQEIDINNPGPDLPEPGVYKVVIDAPSDTMLSKITTNLHKIAFEGPLYPMDNRDVYGKSLQQTRPTTLYSNTPSITLQTQHKIQQTVSAGEQTAKLVQPNQIVDLRVPIDTPVVIPQSDVIVNGTGYFAFTKDQFFSPTKYQILPINDPSDLDRIDYLLTNYTPPQRAENEWMIAEHEFTLNDAIIQKNQLSWIIDSPGLKENNRSIEIKSIEMSLSKQGWLNR